MDLHISLSAEVLFHIGPVPVTNSMITMFAVMAIILIVFSTVARRATQVPTRGQSIIELMLEFIINLVEGTAGKRLGRRLLPLIAGIFIFILFANLTGLLPGMGTIGKWEEEESTDSAQSTEQISTSADQTAASDTEEEEHHDKVLVPFVRAPNADLNMTLAMSLLTFTLVQFAGISAHGVRGRIKHLADPPFLFPIEVISEFARIVSLSARLFGNVFAGEVLLAVMYAMGAAIKIAVIPFLFPVIFMGLEVLFGTIQALVFALLTMIYITLAVAGHDDHDEEHAIDSHGKSANQPVPAGASGD